MWVRAKREDDAMCVWFGSLCRVVVINLSPLVCCVREDATLLKSLKLSVSVGETGHLAAEAVEGAALALERVDDVHGGDGLAARVLGVGHGIADDVLEEHLEDTAGLLVDEAGDALDTTTACEAADGGLGDALDVVAKDLAVALGAALSESLASLSTSRHVVRVCVFVFVTGRERRSAFYTRGDLVRLCISSFANML